MKRVERYSPPDLPDFPRGRPTGVMPTDASWGCRCAAGGLKSPPGGGGKRSMVICLSGPRVEERITSAPAGTSHPALQQNMGRNV